MMTNTNNTQAVLGNVDVVIVGAGAAGLTAAYDLHHDTNFSYVVLEASSGIGGRLQKLEGFADFPIDIGGEWIHVSPEILNVITADRTYNATDDIETVQYLSSYDLWDGDHWNVTMLDTVDYKFVNYTWYDFFHDYIAMDVMDNVMFNCQVTSIDWSSIPLTIACADGQQYTAQHAIVTASIQVLQDAVIDFTPSLPNATQEAIDKFLFMPGIKVFMKFATKFYKDAFEIAEEYLEVNVTSSERLYYSAAYGQETDDNILGVFNVGDLAEEWVNFSEQELYGVILDQLDELFDNQATPNFIEGFVQNWSNETFVKGAYTHLDRDWESYTAIPALAEPVEDRIFFAGEAVPAGNLNHGFAHGAALSGREAAWQIQQLLLNEMMNVDSEQNTSLVARLGDDSLQQEEGMDAASSAASTSIDFSIAGMAWLFVLFFRKIW